MTNLIFAVTIAYLVIQCLTTIGVSIAAVQFVKQVANETQSITRISLVQLWFKTMWKMRNIYSALAVQIFDVMTDILVIGKWYNEENNSKNDIEGIDSKAMAYCSIGVLVFYHVVSAIAVAMIADKKWFLRALAQLFGLLIFEEIFVSHTSVVQKYVSSKSYVKPFDNLLVCLSVLVCVRTQTTCPDDFRNDKNTHNSNQREFSRNF